MSLAWEIEPGNISAELGGDLDFYAKVTGVSKKVYNNYTGTANISVGGSKTFVDQNVSGGNNLSEVLSLPPSFSTGYMISSIDATGDTRFGLRYEPTGETLFSLIFQNFQNKVLIVSSAFPEEVLHNDSISAGYERVIEFASGVNEFTVSLKTVGGVVLASKTSPYTFNSAGYSVRVGGFGASNVEFTNFASGSDNTVDYSLTRPNDLGGTTGINTQNGAGDEYIFTKTADAEDFRDGWQLRATSGNESITTTFEVSEADPLAEPFTDNGFVFKGIDPEETETFATVEPGHKSTIALGMRRVDLVGGRTGWRDLGKRFDTYSIDFPSVIMNPDEAATFEALMKEPRSFYLRNYSGLAPLTPLLDPTGDIRFVVTGYDSRGYADDHAIANRYSLRGVAKYRDIYATFPAQTAAASDCQTSRGSCTLAGVPFPIPDDGFRPNNNERPNGIALHGNAATLDREAKDYTETLELKIEADFVSARSLLYKLVELIRDGDIIFTAPEGSSPFGSQYDGAASYIVILASETITVEKSVGDRFFVSVKLQLKEAV